MKSIINRLSDNLLKGLTQSNLSKFKDLHKNQQCYIFGNGPSIKWMDLSHFKDKIAICTGQLHYHKDFKELDSKYFLLIEPWFFTDRFTRKIFASSAQNVIVKNLKLLSDDYLAFINRNSDEDKEFFVSLSNYFHLRKNNVNFVHRNLPFKSESEQTITENSLSGSFSASLALAYYLGFKEIYLVGFDAMTLYPSANERYYEKKQRGNTNNKPIKDKLLSYLEDKIDISVICHNKSSDILKTREYEDLFKTKAIYKENHEIISKEYLDLLSLSGYKIF